MSKLADILDKIDPHQIEDFLTYAQVKLANLEDATDSDNLADIAKFSQEIHEHANRLHITQISSIAKEIALRASLNRKSDYDRFFDQLRESIYILDQEFSLQEEMLAC